ncbi:PREDICTED: uncharacterized protein LOC108365081 [Rhagoletis zephyria]|uniref:uncharacterized protein LOC108365081 n=1 Tax=Rhagoletis zephyria TaxID=28612 RepID=UPI0008115F01|nr:PREDICTED: uncharacterized protein LOC108365081 [Rhagoletis zephyria]
MQQLARDERVSFPIGADIVFRDFYVDDLISGGESVEEVLEIKRQTSELLSRENPDDIEVLTPAHFLTGAPLTSFVEPDVTLINLNRLDRWQRVSRMQQICWEKWSKEYLTTLQQRAKWSASKPNLSVGAMVLIMEENVPPLKWQLARVIDTIKGNDGVSRVAVLKFSGGTTRRAIKKLCPLPIEDTSVETQSLPTGAGCLENS